MVNVWVRDQSKIAEGVRHAKRHHKRALRLSGTYQNKVACIWIPRNDPRARPYNLFTQFGRANEQLWFSKANVSVKGLKIDIFDLGNRNDDDSA